MFGTDVVILIVLVIFSGLFSGSETALMSLSKAKVNALVKQKRRGSEALFRIKQNPRKLIITILIGNNLVNIGAASFATLVFTRLFGSSGVGVATGVMTFFILIFGEITPKTFATQNAERMSLAFARPLEVLSTILTPLVKFFEVISHIMSKILGSKQEQELSEEELKTIVKIGKEEGLLSKEAAQMMHNILKFEGKKVTKIMKPDADVLMIDGNKKLKDVIEFVAKTKYSRYPVYNGSKDEIIGILDVDDVLLHMKNKKVNVKVKSVVQPAYFIPESKDIDDLLIDFEGKHAPMAIVVDEYGYVSGLVTVEDILEEIVGEIFDKSTKSDVHLRPVNEKLTHVDAKASVELVNKRLHLGLNAGNFNTIAGFIQHKLQRIPKKGEAIELKNVKIIVDKVTKQGIKSVKIIKN